MDFNTGSGGSERPGNQQPPPGSRVSSPRPSMGSGGGDFNLGDPVQSFIRTVREIILNPVGFFRSVPRQGGFVPPLAFAVICATVFGVLSGILSLLINLVSGAQGIGGALGTFIGTIILTPIFTAVALFIVAGIYHLLVLLLVRPSNAGYEATFRVVAYATVVQLVNWLSVIPLLGILVSIVVGVYGLVLGVLGIREVHSTTTGRAVAVILIPTAVLLLIFLVIGSLLLLLFAGSQQQF